MNRKIIGAIVEYNPFHYGHLYHLDQIRKRGKAYAVVCIMSGDFVQRGEPAILDKFARAKMAIFNGVDLVVELPFVYATQDARGFARGAVGILHRMHAVDEIWFGSEVGDMQKMMPVFSVLVDEPLTFKSFLHDELNKGLSFPEARRLALRRYLQNEDDSTSDIVKNSNDILGIEYMIALKHYNSSISPIAIKRIGSGYLQERYEGQFSSATAIRKIMLKGDKSGMKKALPPPSFSICEEEFEVGKGPVSLASLSSTLLARLRIADEAELQRIYGVTEGLENRLIRYARTATDISAFLRLVKTKRFTYTKLSRLLLHIYFGLSKEKVRYFNKIGPQYIRVLGFNKRGQKVLKNMKNTTTIPIITTVSRYRDVMRRAEGDKDRYKDFNEREALEEFTYDLKASDLYSLLYPKASERGGGKDFKTRVITFLNSI
ncbi:MAG: nucleotidyltransferase [Thermotoga sp.]|nr:MAG: nucleotidyltransferase [Thermotoga sp.]